MMYPTLPGTLILVFVSILRFFIITNIYCSVKRLFNNGILHPVYIDNACGILQARTHTMSMPYRVQRIEEFTEQLEAGDLKLRVRVLEVCNFFSTWCMIKYF